MPSHDSGFFESSFQHTRSLIWTPPKIRTLSIAKRRSVLTFQRQSSGASRPPKCSPQPTETPTSQSGTLNASLSSPIRSPGRSKTTSKTKASKKKRATVLHAVPMATTAVPATAPQLSPLERDMATLPNQEILASIGCVSPSSDSHPSTRPLPQSHCTRPRAHSSGASVLSPIHDGAEMKFFGGIQEAKATIGTYRNGRIQWKSRDKKQKDVDSEEPSSPASSQSRRPTIHVVIPEDQRDRPLPQSPFFGPSNHGRSASAEYFNGQEVSPPSGSKHARVRDSLVSPLSEQMQRPLKGFLSFRSSKHHRNVSNQNTLPSISNSSSDDSHGDDASSVYSQPSSRTSVESTVAALPEKLANPRERTENGASSEKIVGGPRVADDPARDGEQQKSVRSETRPCVATPNTSHARPRRYAHHPPIEEDTLFQPTCALRPKRTVSNQARPRISSRRSSSQSIKRRSLGLVSPQNMGVISQAIDRSEIMGALAGIPSPTLSEAENDLEQHLITATDDNPFVWDDVISRKGSNVEELWNAPPPAVPRRSSKRTSTLVPTNTFRLSRIPGDHIASQLKRNGKGKGLTIDIPSKSKRFTEDFVLSPIPIPPKATKRSITPTVAEDVILAILRNLDNLDDLFACAIVNMGFYRVFKRHEIDLMKATLRKMSPPAWEHREICYPGHDLPNTEENLERPREDYTPTSYLQYYVRDIYIIAALKSLIKEKCESFLRPEISVALVSSEPADCARVDDALWRIWTFCKIFGSGKGREEDIVAQMDWLKGGVLVHQKTCTYSVLTTDSLDMNETLASAPECFAKGNEGGLTAEQLFDMMELWNCLGVLLQPFEGRTIQAREFGIYEPTEIRGGDIDGEEMMLDEWYYYLLTLGLSTILDLAGPCRLSDPSAFILASQNGWVNWDPPVFGGTRRNFLKEAASRVYEDKIAKTYAESSTKEVQRQLSKQRIQRHITELRHRKNSGEQLLEVRMSQERPISDWEGVINNLNRPRPEHSIVSHIPTIRSAAAPNSQLSQELTITVPELPAARTPPPPARPASPPRRVIAEPLLPSPPPSTVPSERQSMYSAGLPPAMPSIDEHPAFQHPALRSEPSPNMPRLEEHPAFARHLQSSPPGTSVSSGSAPSMEERPAYLQHPAQRNIYQSDPSQDSADKAVYRIVEMGFTPDQARYALRKTDLGDGLRVDRAVELLLRGD